MQQSNRAREQQSDADADGDDDGDGDEKVNQMFVVLLNESRRDAKSCRVLQSLSLAAISAFAYAQIAPGSNAYLPPTKNGYDYSEPKTPFVSTDTDPI
ncbi:hypothetical protein M5D96_009652 [Drosophila gunungcola]|uniref:Uncharacterized protein n=1 Tax=Drosophila gunungcola TaxID=103775 RepID=A0A9P9YIR0_9MUSC|nr:hypothetical protein M5D96_009652 [Drosophila gunungcola]